MTNEILGIFIWLASAAAHVRGSFRILLTHNMGKGRGEALVQYT